MLVVMTTAKNNIDDARNTFGIASILNKLYNDVTPSS